MPVNQKTANGQLHGKVFEKTIIDGFISLAYYPQAVQELEDGVIPQFDALAPIDIPGRFDFESRLDTSVKTSKQVKSCNEVIHLSDAVRIWDRKEPLRLLVGTYKQVGREKVVDTVIEYIIDEKSWDKLKGGVSFEQVEEARDFIKSIPKGEHIKGRKQAKELIKSIYANQDLEKGQCLIQLNHKVGSVTQRRLQCSIQTKKLLEVLPPSQVKVYKKKYRQVKLPIRILSLSRAEHWRIQEERMKQKHANEQNAKAKDSASSKDTANGIKKVSRSRGMGRGGF